MTLVTVDEVQGSAGLSDTDLTSLGITDNQILEHIYDAQDEIQDFCNTAFLDNESALITATSGTTTSITATGEFAGDSYADHFVYILAGTGAGQWNQIVSHTDDTLTLLDTYTTAPDSTSTFYVVYAPYTDSQGGYFNPRWSDTIDGTGTNVLYLKRRPLLELISLTIDSTSVDTDDVFKYKHVGRLVLSTDASKTKFDVVTPQLVTLTYYMGQYRTSRHVKNAIKVLAAIRLLIQQIGGTYDDVSTFSLPEVNGTIGQAYVNIRETVTGLQQEWKRLEVKLPKHSIFG